MTTSNKPIAIVKLGRIQAAVWEDTTDNGPVCNVTLERRYFDGEVGDIVRAFARLLACLGMRCFAGGRALFSLGQHRNMQAPCVAQAVYQLEPQQSALGGNF